MKEKVLKVLLSIAENSAAEDKDRIVAAEFLLKSIHNDELLKREEV